MQEQKKKEAFAQKDDKEKIKQRQKDCKQNDYKNEEKKKWMTWIYKYEILTRKQNRIFWFLFI